MNKDKSNCLDEIIGTLSMTSLIYSLYWHHKHCTLGVCVITGVSIAEIVKFYWNVSTPPQEDAQRLHSNSTGRIPYMSRTTLLMQIFSS
ncbi:uncharacterized protein LOC143214320 [Lasioglossum baleicum]|uniref:uncharacterized protein LOC143214320 n=1 Tax=Lasioglossum baleicum TaxID=434251 RepID=UPI003FCE6654